MDRQFEIFSYIAGFCGVIAGRDTNSQGPKNPSVPSAPMIFLLCSSGGDLDVQWKPLMKQPYFLIRPILLGPFAKLKIETPNHLRKDQVHFSPGKTADACQRSPNKFYAKERPYLFPKQLRGPTMNGSHESFLSASNFGSASLSHRSGWNARGSTKLDG